MEENILEKIYSAVLKFLVPLSPDETYALIVEEAIKLVRAEHGSIFLGRNRELERVYTTSPLFYKIQPRKRGMTYSVFKTRKTRIFTHREVASAHPEHPEIKELGARSNIMIPLAYRNKSLGVLSVISKRNKVFSDRELETLRLFGSMASLAIRKTELYDEAQKALETRDVFISMAAHELRTPLTSVSGYVQLLYSKLHETDTAESRWTTQLLAETLRLNRLVNELLEVNKIRTGNPSYILSEISLFNLLEKAVNNIRLTYPDRKVIYENKLKLKDDIIIGNSEKLSQALLGLLNNACKFSYPQGEIKTTLDYKYPYFLIEIKDKGKGINDKDLKKSLKDFIKKIIVIIKGWE